MKRTLIFLLVPLFAACLCGCQTVKNVGAEIGKLPGEIRNAVMPKITGPDDSRIVRIGVFDDLPVPPNFVLQPEESFAFEHGSFRNARQVYKGAVHMDIVTKFFETQMPVLGWTPISSFGAGYRKTWRFDKAHDACTIEARYVEDYTVLTVRVSYK